jgi:hypothetical protein
MRTLCTCLLVLGLALAAPAVAGAASASLRATALPVTASSERQTQRFDLVGLHWRGSGTIRFSTHTVGGGWSAWHAAAPEGDDQPDPGTAERAAQRGWQIGSPFWAGLSDGIRYRVAGHVTGLRAYFVLSAAASVPARRLQIASSPQIIPRSGWNADEEIRRGQPRYATAVHFALVHHTAGSNSYTAAQSPAIVKAIELYHVKGNGWNDIGYNFLVDKYGQVFEGRYGGMTRAVIGAHAQGFNTGSVGVALIGNYGAAQVTPAAEEALAELLAWRLDLAHVDPKSRVTAISGGNPKYAVGTALSLHAVSGHRDVYPTSCPGNALYKLLPSLAETAQQTGLPKIYAAHLAGTLGGPIRFTAKLSGTLPWTVTVTDATKVVVATGSGAGDAVDWTWDATAATAGSYRWTISTPGARSATSTLGGKPASGGTGGAGGTGGVGGTGGTGGAAATVASFVAGPGVVTPNGDGIDDALTLTYTLSAAAPVTATILSGTTPVAAAFTGDQTKGAQTLTWAPPPELPDGSYTVTVATPKSAVSAPFLIDRTLGALSATPSLFSPNGDGRLEATTVAYTLAQPATVDVRIEQSGAIVADLGTQTLQPGPQQLVWNGTAGGVRVADGSYDAIVSATDTVATVTQRVPLTLDTTAPAVNLVAFATLRFTTPEAANVIAIVNGKRIALVVHAGAFRIPFKGKPRTLVLIATDAAGNRSRLQKR